MSRRIQASSNIYRIGIVASSEASAQLCAALNDSAVSDYSLDSSAIQTQLATARVVYHEHFVENEGARYRFNLNFYHPERFPRDLLSEETFDATIFAVAKDSEIPLIRTAADALLCKTESILVSTSPSSISDNKVTSQFSDFTPENFISLRANFISLLINRLETLRLESQIIARAERDFESAEEPSRRTTRQPNGMHPALAALLGEFGIVNEQGRISRAPSSAPTPEPSPSFPLGS